MTKKAIIWLKTDLRLHDNETLIKALESNNQLILVYCFDERHYKDQSLGFRKTGYFKTKFILESLNDLHLSLVSIGAGLTIAYGKTEEEIGKLAKAFDVINVYSQKEIAPEEVALEKLVAKELNNIDCLLHCFHTGSLYADEDLPFSIIETPDQFTNYRLKAEKSALVKPSFPIAHFPTPVFLTEFKLPTFEDLGISIQLEDSRTAFPFTGGEQQALARLHSYFFESRHIANYKETRNEMIGTEFSTKFSAWLAIGCISPRYIYEKVKEYEATFGANESTYWITFELLWRDYFRLMIQKYSVKFFQKTGIKKTAVLTQPYNEKAFMLWIDGQTPAELVNAAMKELRLTGYISNRARQVVASYLCNDLTVDWRYGAAYFEAQLIDYDVCSNWANWAYVAGVGNDPRGNRYFNIDKQAEIYDPEGKYRRLWLNDN
jgi:deoxyribodipyrimidine photo-lyase